MENVTIQNTKITGFLYGINLGSSSHSTLSGNTIEENGYSHNMFWDGAGIDLTQSDNNIITNNNLIKNFNAGIELQTSSNNNITENQVIGDTTKGNVLYGIWLEIDSSNNTLSRNTITDTTGFNWDGSGIQVSVNSDYNTISENILRDNDYGIYLDGSYNTVNINNISCERTLNTNLWISGSHNIISGNNLEKNNDGIDLIGSQNELQANNVSEAGEYTIVVRNAANNKIFHNNFEGAPGFY